MLDGMKSRFNESEEWTNDLEDKLLETNQLEQRKKRIMQNNKIM